MIFGPQGDGDVPVEDDLNQSLIDQDATNALTKPDGTTTGTIIQTSHTSFLYLYPGVPQDPKLWPF